MITFSTGGSSVAEGLDIFPWSLWYVLETGFEPQDTDFGEGEIAYGIPYKQNLKWHDRNEFIYKADTDSQTYLQKEFTVASGGGWEEG